MIRKKEINVNAIAAITEEKITMTNARRVQSILCGTDKFAETKERRREKQKRLCRDAYAPADKNSEEYKTGR